MNKLGILSLLLFFSTNLIWAQCDDGTPLGSFDCPYVYSICPGQTQVVSAYAVGALPPAPDNPTCNCSFSVSPSTGTDCSNCAVVTFSPSETTMYNFAWNNFNIGDNGDSWILIEVEDCGDSNDAGITGMFETKEFLYGGTKDVTVFLRNYGFGQLDNVSIHWSVNGAEQTPFYYDAEILAATESIEVTIGQYNFLLGNKYDLEFWTTLPNGVEDTNPSNDKVVSTVFIEDNGVDPTLVAEADEIYTICNGSVLATPFPFSVGNCGLVGGPVYSNIMVTPSNNVVLPDPFLPYVDVEFTPNENTFYNFSMTYEYTGCIAPYTYESDIYVVVDECTTGCNDPYAQDWVNNLIDNLNSELSACITYEIVQTIESGIAYYHFIVEGIQSEECPDVESVRMKYNCNGNIVEIVYGYLAANFFEGSTIYDSESIETPDCTNNTGIVSFDTCDNGELYFFITTDEGLYLDPYYADGIEFENFEGQVVNFDFVLADFESPCTGATAVTITCIREKPKKLRVAILLEGNYEGFGFMNTDLMDNNLLPLEQPFNTPPWNYEGTETISTTLAESNGLITDWVLLELRAGTPGLGDVGTTVVSRKAVLLKDGGYLIDADNEMTFGDVDIRGIAEGDSYHIAIRHRNHLDVLSAEPLTFLDDFTAIQNFTLGVENAFGPAQLKELPDGYTVLYAGDFNADGIIQTTDYDAWQELPAAVNVYTPTDANLDGVIQATDYDLWFLNKAKVGSIEIQY